MSAQMPCTCPKGTDLDRAVRNWLAANSCCIQASGDQGRCFKWVTAFNGAWGEDGMNHMRPGYCTDCRVLEAVKWGGWDVDCPEHTGGPRL